MFGLQSTTEPECVDNSDQTHADTHNQPKYAVMNAEYML